MPTYLCYFIVLIIAFAVGFGIGYLAGPGAWTPGGKK